MAKYKEIEVKWCSDHVPRDEFNLKLRRFLASQEYLYKLVRVEGPDTYFSDTSGRTIRHRKSRNTHELTSKQRLHKKSIKARKEVNVRLALNQPVEDVFELLGMLGLNKEFTLTKDCDIYFISGNVAHVSIVWYKVQTEGHDAKVFIEVEVEGLSHNKSLKVLRWWIKKLQSMYDLSSKHVSDESLYEIYSGKRYVRVVRRRKKR